jgi:uncharacterized glyoxalase superfamily protein PhnB
MRIDAYLFPGGTQDSPLENVFWGDIVALTDTFGINWQVNIGSAPA